LSQTLKYRTLKNKSEGLYKEKGSKFIAYAVPCSSEEEAKNYLNEWRKQHHQSRHLCYAYRFGIDGELYRANDDGEPSNSAGQPILGQLLSFELTNVLVGVLRYFGGTKLGVGGLITAYKTAAKEAIEANEIIEKEVKTRLDISFDYADMQQVMSMTKQFQTEILAQQFELKCFISIAIKIDELESFMEKFTLLTTIKITNKGIC
jgi:uncharacterized YigZ family protein